MPRVTNDTQRAWLNAREAADILGEVGANWMGDFSEIEAAFFHSATASLVAWLDAVESRVFAEADK